MAVQALPAPVTALERSQAAGKRVTRSSLGGKGSLQRETPGWQLELPLSTVIQFRRVAPQDLEHHPRPTLSPATSPQPTIESHPSFRLLRLEDSFGGRSRHAGVAETDTTDAFYQRLHRFPEVLEKRSARLERDRLIHERAKLIQELEDLRGRGWVYSIGQGGRSEEERKRKIREGEERLQRYDYLLPNQPRKSGMLNLGGHLASGPPSVTAADSRSGSPALAGPSRDRHSTPLSASNAGESTTKIRIKFGPKVDTAPPTSPRFARRGPIRSEKRKYREPDEGDESDESDESEGSEMDGVSGDHSTAYPLSGRRPRITQGYSAYRRRDRKAERIRAAERVRLGLPARSKLAEDNPLAFSRQAGTESARSLRSSSPISTPERVSRGSPAVSKRRQRDSFFDSETLRESVFASASAKSGRRSSSRVAYAFGHRLFDHHVFVREFDLHGGVSDSEREGHTARLEDLVRERCGEPADAPRSHFVNGVAVPTSALIVRGETATSAAAATVPPSSPELYTPAEDMQAVSASPEAANETIVLTLRGDPKNATRGQRISIRGSKNRDVAEA